MQQSETDFGKIPEQGQQLMMDVLTKKIPANQKKNYNVLNEFLQHTDRREFKILVDFEMVSENNSL